MAMAAVVLTGAVGCATGVFSRIQEKSELFANLPARVQQNLRDGQIGVGYSPDLVYIALGAPTETATQPTTEGPVEIWTYRRYFGDMAPQSLPSYQNIRQEIANAQGVGGPSTNPMLRGCGGTPTQPNLELDVANGDTLYVLFYRGRVFDIRLASRRG